MLQDFISFKMLRYLFKTQVKNHSFKIQVSLFYVTQLWLIEDILINYLHQASTLIYNNKIIHTG